MDLPAALRQAPWLQPEREKPMAFVMFTRPDGSPVGIDSGKVASFAPVPTSGPTMGPLKEGTRIVFENKTHQDVKELVAEVERRLNGAGPAALEAVMPMAAPKASRASKPKAKATRAPAARRKPKPAARKKPAARG
jgi:hypothetical protein